MKGRRRSRDREQGGKGLRGGRRVGVLEEIWTKGQGQGLGLKGMRGLGKEGRDSKEWKDDTIKWSTLS